MNPRSAHRNLVDAVAALTRAGIRPFLVDGTLLGAVRDGDFMAHDRDIDLGVFIEEWHPGLLRCLRTVGFVHRKTYGTVGRGLEYSFRRSGIKLDTFFYYRDGARVYHAAWLAGTPIRYEYPAFDLAPLTFRGEQFLAPQDPEAFLVAKYGPDWRVPVTQWDWAWGPRNAREWAA